LNTPLSNDEAVNTWNCASAPPAVLKAWIQSTIPVTLLHGSDWPASHRPKVSLVKDLVYPINSGWMGLRGDLGQEFSVNGRQAERINL
jgi:hypothetical protein